MGRMGPISGLATHENLRDKLNTTHARAHAHTHTHTQHSTHSRKRPQMSDMRVLLLHDKAHLVQTWLCGHGPTSYRQGFEKWISRLDKCINREGDCVEK
jgi:hypothetical protein